MSGGPGRPLSQTRPGPRAVSSRGYRRIGHASQGDTRLVRGHGRYRMGDPGEMGGPGADPGQRGSRVPFREPAQARRRAVEPGPVRAFSGRQLLLLRGELLRLQEGRLVLGPGARWPVGDGRARVRAPADPRGARALLPGAPARVEALARPGRTPLGTGLRAAVGRARAPRGRALGAARGGAPVV